MNLNFLRNSFFGSLLGGARNEQKCIWTSNEIVSIDFKHINELKTILVNKNLLFIYLEAVEEIIICFCF